MRRMQGICTALVLGAAVAVRVVAGDFRGCTGGDGCAACVPACTATWGEAKAPGKPRYSMKCEHAGARDRDSWHAPAPECRSCPPGGRLYVKKRLYKEAGAEKTERVPKYEVASVPVTCDLGRPSWWARLCDCFAW